MNGAEAYRRDKAVKPEVNGRSGKMAGPGAKLRMPTVHEALPYTPLSAIVPFNPDVIPHPLATPTTSPSAFTNLEDVKYARRVLDKLSAGATSAETASRRCQQTIRDVQKLLDADSLTQYKFKQPKRSQASRVAGESSKLRSPPLSSFAKMVLDSTNVAHRYLTPESPDLKPEDGIKVETPAPQPARANSNQPFHNGYVATPNDGVALSSQLREARTVIPASLTPAQRAQYQVYSDPHSAAGAQHTNNSRPNDNIVLNGTRTSIDQRQRGDMMLQNLQDLMSSIFEAEDQLESTGTEIATEHTASLFVYRDTDQGPIAVLQPEVQSKLETSLQKVTSFGRLDDLDVDSLIRVQRLCDSILSAVDSLSLHIGEDWCDQDIDEWLVRVNLTETALIALRTSMRIMIGGSQTKELQSEDYLRRMLQTLTTAIDGCIVPIVETPALAGEKIRGEKSGPPPNPNFVIASSNKQPLLSLLNAATKCMRVLGDLLIKTDFDEVSLSGVDHLCTALLFAENVGTEKESALGIQNFETMRRCAMDVFAKIFTKYTDQRQSIFDEILISLEKLPATKQSARQYRLVDAKPIQLVSALLMRLVQTSAMSSNEALKHREQVQDDEDADASDEDSAEDETSDDEEVIKVSHKKSSSKGQDLFSMVKPLHDAAQTNASYIVKVLIQRAVSTSKTSDEPYRRLLDIFTEDFLNVLGSSDWPAAELLLRTLVLHMISIIENPKTAVPSRTLALELLGVMGSGILELQIAARTLARGIDEANDMSRHLCRIVEQLEAGNADTREVAAFEGPHRVVIEHLENRGIAKDAQLQTARGYHLMQWAFSVVGGREGSTDSDASDAPRASKDLQSNIKNMLLDAHWLDEHSDLPPPSTQSGRLAAMVVTLNSKFCRAFHRMFGTLLSSMSSEQSTVKSRSLKSVVVLLETDPTILDRNSYVLNHIFRCATDPSTLVRDSALGLISKCISLRPTLDAAVYQRVIGRTKDAATSVRKRAMKILKDIYLRNQSTEVRSAIADAIITRIEDSEESVAEIARTTMEEIWFHPFYHLNLNSERAVEAKVAYASQAALLIATLEHSNEVHGVLEALLKRLLTSSKAATENSHVCKTLIAVLFDGIIDNSDIPGTPAQDAILRCLTIFARASPKLFSAAQLERLEPYTQNLSTSDDLDVYRSVISILRFVVPHQSMIKEEFLKKMLDTLLKSITRLQKTELAEVAPCLWTVACRVMGTQRLATTIMSVISGIYGMHDADFATDQMKATKIVRLIRIAGEFGNACDFTDHFPSFQSRCTWYKGDSVPGLIAETVCAFTSPKRPLSIRLAALEAVCTVSQAWPQQFLRADVTTAFEIVFRDHESSLEEVLLAGLESFFRAQEVPDGTEDGLELGGGVATGSERLGRTYVASDQDGASTSLAQRFLPQILRLALSSYDEPAFIAAKLVVSINKQGLVHPKESGPALVALETCPNKSIAAEAFKEHKAQHQKHETLFEKEYMRAVQQAFEYQQKVVGDPLGYAGQPPTSKIHLTWEVLKLGKAQVRKKFLSNMAQKMDFDFSKSDSTTSLPLHLLFVRFCAESLALFDYDKVDDLLHLLSSLEKTFAGTGSVVAQAIESEVLKIQVNGFIDPSATLVNGSSTTMPAMPTSPGIDPARLAQLATAAQCLSLIWESRSFLRRLWNTQKYTAKTKQNAKETAKAPSRATNAPSLTEAYLGRVSDVMSSALSTGAQRAVCAAFVDLISVDSEVKVGTDEDADGSADVDMVLANGYDTPGSENTSGKSPSAPPSSGKRGRKRKLSDAGGSPKKKRGRPRLDKKGSTGGRSGFDGDEDGGWD